MKNLLIVFFLFLFFKVSAQEDQINVILKNVKRDSTDKTCKNLFFDLYNCFDSDEGQANPKMIDATLSLFKYKSDAKLPNQQLILLFFQYENATSEPEKALKWIQALNEEYRNVYNESNPLILLYKGESLGQANHNEEAYTHFRNFLKEYPQSVMALVNVYGTEKDQKLKRYYFDKLKSKYPNNWAVKSIKMD